MTTREVLKSKKMCLGYKRRSDNKEVDTMEFRVYIASK